MNVREPASYTAEELSNPTIEPLTLYQVASVRPDLWTTILALPHCPTDLAMQIRQRLEGTSAAPATPAPAAPASAVPAPAAAAPAAPAPSAAPIPESTSDASALTTAAWSEHFTMTYGHEPTLAEYQAALSAGQILPDPVAQAGSPARDATVQNPATGAKQAMTGAESYLITKVDPAAVEAAQTFQLTVTRGSGSEAGGTSRWQVITQFILLIAAFIATISLFLPAETTSLGIFGSQSFSYLSNPIKSEGSLLVVLFLAIIVFSLTALVTRSRWRQITAGGVGFAAGAIGMIDGFDTLAEIGSPNSYYSGVSAGPGLFLLTLCAVIIFACAFVLLIVTLRSPKTTTLSFVKQPISYGQWPQPSVTPQASQVPGMPVQQAPQSAPQAPGAPTPQASQGPFQPQALQDPYQRSQTNS